MDLTEEQIKEFNSLYKKACDKMKGLILLDGYRPASLGLFEKIRAKKAIKYFEQILLIHPQHFQSLFFLGKLFQRLGDYNASLNYFETALKFETKNHSLPQEASLIAMHLNQIDKAIEYSNEALKRKPDDYALMGNHAMNLLIANRDSEAKETIDKAVSINPNDDINNRIKIKIDAVISGREKRTTFKEALG